MTPLFALLAAIVSAAFSGVVLARFLHSRQPAFAAWAVGLMIFAAAASFQAVGEAQGFSAATFRGFYLLGGVLGVVYLALGTIFLLAPRRVAYAVTAVLAVITLASVWSALTVAVNEKALATSAGVLGEAIERGTLLHVAAVVLNIVGSLVLIGGSAWSAWRFVRRSAPLDRVVCNVLLTAGAFVIAAGFSAAKVAGSGLDVLGLYELIGIGVMFSGFLALGRIRQRAAQPSTLRSANPPEGVR